MQIDKQEEALIGGVLHDMCRRLDAAQKQVLELSQKDPALYPPDIAEMIWRARRYVLKDMAYKVGVRKLAREKWGMLLASPA